MKFLTIASKQEGGAMPSNSFISMGKCYERRRQKGGHFGVEIFDNEIVENGYYVKIEIPFTFNRRYIDPNDFEVKKGPCRLTIGLLARRPMQEGKLVRRFMKLWTPMNYPFNQPVYIEN